MNRLMLWNDPFISELTRALGLPRRTRSFELRCAVGEAVAVKCEYFPDETAPINAGPLLVEYRLMACGGSVSARPVIPQPTPVRHAADRSDAIAAGVVALVPVLALLGLWFWGG